MTNTNQQEVLYNAVTELDDTYLAEALRPARPAIRQTVKRIASVVAAFVLIILISSVGNNSATNDPTAIPHGSPFVLIAKGADGKETALTYNPSILESDLDKTDNVDVFFGHNPTFKLYITLNEVAWDTDFAVTYTYDGETVTTFHDKHIVIFHVGSYMLEMMAWFDKPVDLVFRVWDEESGETLQSYTVHAEPSSDGKSYILNIIDQYINEEFYENLKEVSGD